MSILVDFKGMVTAPGQLMRSPASCVDVDSFQFPAPGMMQKRRGFARLTGASVGGPIYALFNSQRLGSTLVAHTGNSTTGQALRYGTGAGSMTPLTNLDSANVTRANSPRIHMMQSGSDYYFSSDEGVRRVEASSPLLNVRSAGMPHGLPPTTYSMDSGVLEVLTPSATGFMAAGSNCAYRVTWHRLGDAPNQPEYGGPPTGRVVYRNVTGFSGYTGAACNTYGLIPIPYELGSTSTALQLGGRSGGTNYFYRLWRSRTFAVETADDEMYLVAEKFVSEAEIAGGVTEFFDITPDSFLQNAPRLHTNPTNYPQLESNLKNGILNSDNAPPRCWDMAEFAGCAWYANTQYRDAVSLQLVGTLSPGDTVTIDGQVFTAVAEAAFPTNVQFRVVTSGISVALNLEGTARNIVEQYNAFSASNSAYAFYTSVGPNTGGMYFESKLMSTASLIISCSRNGAIRGLSNGGLIDVEPAPRTAPNELVYSKPLRPDAVAPINALTAGGQDSKILKLQPFRDVMFVFATSGLYMVTGSSWVDFNCALFDASFKLIAPECVAVVDDAVYAWGASGIARIDTAGAEIISTPIKPTVDAVVANATTTSVNSLFTSAFAVGYRLQHRVQFWFPDDTAYSPSAAAIQCVQALEFNTSTNSWTRIGSFRNYTGTGFTKGDSRSCGVIRSTDDALVLGNWCTPAADCYLFPERALTDSTPYVDTDRAGVDHAVSSAALLQLQTPEADGSQHWQETVIHTVYGATSSALEPTSGGQFPTALAISFTSDNPAVSSQSLTITSGVTRVEPPQGARRSTRLQVALSHTVAEPCTITGIVQTVGGGGSRYPK